MRLWLLLFIPLTGCFGAGGSGDPATAQAPDWLAGDTWVEQITDEYEYDAIRNGDRDFGGGSEQQQLTVQVWNTTAIPDGIAVLATATEDGDERWQAAMVTPLGGGPMDYLRIQHLWGDEYEYDIIEDTESAVLPALRFPLVEGDKWTDAFEIDGLSGTAKHVVKGPATRDAGGQQAVGLLVETTIRLSTSPDDVEAQEEEMAQWGTNLIRYEVSQDIKVESLWDAKLGYRSYSKATADTTFDVHYEDEYEGYESKGTSRWIQTRYVTGFTPGTGVERSLAELSEATEDFDPYSQAPSYGLRIYSDGNGYLNANDARTLNFWYSTWGATQFPSNATFAWSVLNGLGEIVGSGDKESFSHPFDQVGYYAVRLDVRQDGRPLDWDYFTVYVDFSTEHVVDCQQVTDGMTQQGGCDGFSFEVPHMIDSTYVEVTITNGADSLTSLGAYDVTVVDGSGQERGITKVGTSWFAETYWANVYEAGAGTCTITVDADRALNAEVTYEVGVNPYYQNHESWYEAPQ